MNTQKSLTSLDEVLLNSPDRLEQRIGYNFHNKTLLIEALSHPSLRQHNTKNTIHKSYERLEFLGDTVINFVITEMLFNNFTNYDEGKLAKIRAYLVCKELLCKVASTINLSEYIIMTHGEETLGGRNNLSNIENTMEALIAAIYLDSDINQVKEIIHNLWQDFMYITDLTDYDPKSTLQELVQKNNHNKPVYKILHRDGPAHSSTFTVSVTVDNQQEIGTGRSIKEAEKDAARKLLNILKDTKLF